MAVRGVGSEAVMYSIVGSYAMSGARIRVAVVTGGGLDLLAADRLGYTLCAPVAAARLYGRREPTQR